MVSIDDDANTPLSLSQSSFRSIAPGPARTLLPVPLDTLVVLLDSDVEGGADGGCGSHIFGEGGLVVRG